MEWTYTTCIALLIVSVLWATFKWFVFGDWAASMQAKAKWEREQEAMAALWMKEEE